MIYALTAVIIIQAVVFAWVVHSLSQQAREERSSLEMKLLAVCNAPAAVHVESLEKGQQGSVTYMDDQEMVRREKATR